MLGRRTIKSLRKGRIFLFRVFNIQEWKSNPYRKNFSARENTKSLISEFEIEISRPHTIHVKFERISPLSRHFSALNLAGKMFCISEDRLLYSKKRGPDNGLALAVINCLVALRKKWWVRTIPSDLTHLLIPLGSFFFFFLDPLFRRVSSGHCVKMPEKQARSTVRNQLHSRFRSSYECKKCGKDWSSPTVLNKREWLLLIFHMIRYSMSLKTIASCTRQPRLTPSS